MSICHLRSAVAALVLIPVAGESATLEASFGSAADIPVLAPSYQAAGNTVSISLGFAPAAGSRLTVVKVTGLDPIDGEFSNLAQGQTVLLNHGGTGYPFVANYFGGSGNDLVLHWANTEVYSWGSNASGQLGVESIPGQPGAQFTAVPVSSMYPVSAFRHRFPVAVACGQDHTLALCSDGAVIGWNSNAYGQLGNGATSGGQTSTEVVRSGVLAGRTIKAIAAGVNFSLAVCTDGRVAAWGRNDNGQLGQGPGNTGDSSVPLLVPQTGVLAGREVVSIAAGGNLALAICSDGRLVSWGTGARGVAGTPDGGTPGLVDASGVLASRSVVSASTNGQFVLAICSDGSAVTWGWNDYGQLGVGDNTTRSTPVLVNHSGPLAGKSVVAGAVGGSHALVLCSDGSLASWGSNSYGSLGNGTHADSMVPVAVDQSGILAGRRVTSVGASRWGSFALCSDGFLVGWGATHVTISAELNLPYPVGNLGALAGRSVIQVVSGSSFATALCSDGMIAGWGYNPSVGVSNEIPAAITPVDVGPYPFGKPVLTLANGEQHCHALLADGSIWSWGGNFHGQLGAGLTPADGMYRPVPVAVPIPGASGGRRVSSVAAGTQHGLALCTDGSLFAWGSNSYGTLGSTGIGFKSIAPVPVDQSGVLAGKRVIRIWAQEKYNMALCSDGSLATWGENFGNEKGNGGPYRADTPVLVASNGALAGRTVVDLAAGPSHLLALCSDGSLVAWGWNTHGSLGDGSTTLRTSPVAVDMSGVLAGKTIVDLAIRTHENIVLCSDGTLAAWGSTDTLLPQVPNGTNGHFDRSLPALVDFGSLLAPGETPLCLESDPTNLLITTSLGRVIALGSNGFGRLGRGISGTVSSPGFVDMSVALAGAGISLAIPGGSHATAIVNRRKLLAGIASDAGPLTVGREIELDVASSVSRIVLTATAVEPGVDISIGGRIHASAVPGPELPLAPGPNSFPIRLTTPAGDSETYLLVVNRALPSMVSALASLVPDQGVLSPGFEAGRFLYTVDLPYETSGIRFTASAADAGAGILIDGSAVAGDALSPEIALPVGETQVSIRVNAGDGIRYSVYTVTVRRAAPPPATLASLKPSIGSLEPAFNPLTGTYRMNVPDGASQIRWLAVASDARCVVKIQGVGAASGVWSGFHPLRHGLNRFTITVTNIAEETVSYTVDVTRAAPSAIATLKSLRLSNVVLKPAFKSGVTAYAATVPASVKSVTVSPVATEARAVVRINGRLLKTGSRSAVVALGGASTVIRVLVTAPNGSSRKTYTVTIQRATAKRAAVPADMVASDASPDGPMTYQDWVMRNFTPGQRLDPAVTGMRASPVGDGLPNLVKFALGLDAGAVDASMLPKAGFDDGRLVMRYTVFRETAGARILVEAADFPTGPWSELPAGSASRNADGSITFRVTDSEGAADAVSRFMRLKVAAE